MTLKIIKPMPTAMITVKRGIRSVIRSLTYPVVLDIFASVIVKKVAKKGIVFNLWQSVLPSALNLFCHLSPTLAKSVQPRCGLFSLSVFEPRHTFSALCQSSCPNTFVLLLIIKTLLFKAGCRTTFAVLRHRVFGVSVRVQQCHHTQRCRYVNLQPSRGYLARPATIEITFLMT